MISKLALYRVIGVCILSACCMNARSQSVGAGSEPQVVPSATDSGGATFFGGVRLWVNRFDLANVHTVPTLSMTNPPQLVLQTVITESISNTTVAPIPFIGVRYGNFVGAASYMINTTYDVNDASLGDASLGSVKREELDVSLGYAVIPSVVVSVGYKQAKVDKISGQFTPSNVKISGILLGASASAPLTDRIALYGNTAYGFTRQDTNFPPIVPNSRINGSYLIGEIGITYTAYQGVPGAAFHNVSLNVGYRAQTYTARSVPLATLTPDFVILDTQYKDVRQTTNGFVIGLAASF